MNCAPCVDEQKAECSYRIFAQADIVEALVQALSCGVQNSPESDDHLKLIQHTDRIRSGMLGK